MDRLFVIIGCLLTVAQGISPSQVKIEPENPFVYPSQNVSILCQVEHPLRYCRIKLQGFRNALVLDLKSKPNKEFQYFGSGLDQGQCGITLFNVMDKANGLVECTPLPDTDTAEEMFASTTITVVRSPKKPVLTVAHSQTSLRTSVFREGDILEATCSVRDGRPLANITWYLGDDVIQDGIKTFVSNDRLTDLRSITQTVRRNLSWRDNSKVLRCVAGHLAMNTESETTRKLNITYSPKSMTKTIELYGLTRNKTQNITAEIFANPAPSFTWVIGKSAKLVEGQHHSDGNFIAQWSEYLGQDKWKVVLRVERLTAADLGKEYSLIAKNSVGQKSFSVLISTDDGPRFQLALGSVVLIVIVCVCLATLGVTVYVFIAQRRKRELVIEPTHTEKITQLKVDM